jgi:hypothetical protein
MTHPVIEANLAQERWTAMTRLPAEPLRLDYLIRAGAVHSMAGVTYRAVGLSGTRIAAVSTYPVALAVLAGRDTTIADAGDLTLPSLTHANT